MILIEFTSGSKKLLGNSGVCLGFAHIGNYESYSKLRFLLGYIFSVEISKRKDQPSKWTA